MNIKKLSKITGLGENETKKAFGFTFTGIFLLLVSFFVSSCGKNGVREENKAGEVTQESYNLEKTTTSIRPVDDLVPKKSCGPTPGYPCGTKYHTVSIRDFRIS